MRVVGVIGSAWAAWSVALAGCSVGAGGFFAAGENEGPVAVPVGAHRGPMSVAILGARGIYDETVWLAFLRDYPLAVTRIDLISAHLDDRTFAGFDIVILDHLTRTFDADEAAALASWVHAGGSLIALAGFVNDSADVQPPSSLLAALPIRYTPGLIALDVLTHISDFSAHPTTAGLASVPFFGGYHVALTGTCDGDTQVIASLDRDPVAAACQHGAGRVYVWGDEWVDYSSQWDGKTDAPRFWKNAIDWLTHRT